MFKKEYRISNWSVGIMKALMLEYKMIPLPAKMEEYGKTIAKQMKEYFPNPTAYFECHENVLDVVIKDIVAKTLKHFFVAFLGNTLLHDEWLTLDENIKAGSTALFLFLALTVKNGDWGYEPQKIRAFLEKKEVRGDYGGAEHQEYVDGLFASWE